MGRVSCTEQLLVVEKDLGRVSFCTTVRLGGGVERSFVIGPSSTVDIVSLEQAVTSLCRAHVI